MTASLNRKEFCNFVLNYTKGLYVICSAKRTESFSKQDRCDADSWGPSGPLRVDDERINTIFGSSIVTNVNQLEKYRIVYSFPPYGYIIHIELRHPGAPEDYDFESEYKLLNEEDPPCAAKTFGDLIKLTIEWSKMKDTPWNNTIDPLVEICSKFLESIGLSEDAIEKIDQTYFDMQVYKFLKGSEDARRSNPEGNIVDAEIVDIISSKIPEEWPSPVFSDDE